MFHFISPSLRSGFMESYIISTSNWKNHSIQKRPQETSRFGRGRLGAPQGLHALGRWWCHNTRGRDGLGQRSLPGLANHGLGGVGWRYLGPQKGEVFLLGWIWKGMKFDDKMYSTLFRDFLFFLREMFGLVGYETRGNMKNYVPVFLGWSKKKWNMYLYVFFFCKDLDFGVWTFVAIRGGSWWFESVADGIFVSGSALLCQYDSPSKRMDLNEKGRVRSVRGEGLKSILATRNSTNCSVNPHRS